MEKPFDGVVKKLLTGSIDKDLSAEKEAALYYNLYEKLAIQGGMQTPRREVWLSEGDQQLLSDIMEYFFYPDQAVIAREVFSKALVVAASKVLRSYSK